MGKYIQCGDDVSLAHILAQIAPRSILVLGPQMEPAISEYLAAHPDVGLTHIAADDCLGSVDAESRFDFVFLSRVLEKMRKSQASQLIAVLRDRFQVFYVKVLLGKSWLHHASFWEPNDLRSLGMDAVSLSAERGRPMGLFRFDSSAYKTATEWLNSKYWAQLD